ncbi:MAG: hypothetical protein FWC86_00015 [Coriobacteriia bacterium]|nr:hypothetical protein [Coriobacteriia bacterium]
MNLVLRIVWSAALLVIIAALGWFVLSPATAFMADFGTEQQIGLLFVFIWMPSILFLLISSGQLFKSWHQSAAIQQYVWIALSWIYAFGLAAVLYFRFVAG